VLIELLLRLPAAAVPAVSVPLNQLPELSFKINSFIRLKFDN